MGLLFGLLTALSIGASDLFGRRVARAQSPITATVPMQFFGILTAAAALLVIPSQISAKALGLGVLSGLGFALGLGCYYTGLGKASSAILAPMVAMLSSILPFAYTVVRGDEPSALTLGGAAICLVGLGIITINRNQLGIDWVALRWGALAGLGYATGVISLIDVSDESGTWSAVSQRTTACIALTTVALVTKVPPLPARNMRLPAALAGMAVGLSSIFLLVGLSLDPTPTVIGSSLFPAVSVVVGLVAYGDDVRTAQWFGIVVVILGIIGVSLG